MERKILSKRTAEILDQITLLNNVVRKNNPADIRHNPENYEALSINAALRSENITCRLRHLIYASTSVRKSG